MLWAARVSKYTLFIIRNTFNISLAQLNNIERTQFMLNRALRSANGEADLLAVAEA